MKQDTLGRLLVDAALPPEVERPKGPLTAKALRDLFQSLAEKTPEKYRETAKRLTDLSADASLASGGYSFGPEHLRPTAEVRAAQAEFQKSVRKVLSTPGISDKERNDQLVKTALEHMEPTQDAVTRSASAAKNPLYLQVASGAKGKPENLKSLLAGDTLYLDANYDPVPFPVTHSFYEGLRPSEYYGGTFGARLSLILTKLGTAKGGYYTKRLRNTAHRLLVTARDAEHTDFHDPPTGLRTPLADADNEGSVLAQPAGGFPRNTVLTGRTIADLKRRGISDVYVRSPMIGGPTDGGVYSLDAGIRERGRLAPLGDQIGMAAADALGEPATQAIIGCLAEGTLVRMADWSVKPIEAVRVGDRALGADSTGRTFPVDVTRTFDNGTRACVRTVFSFGKRDEEIVLESTPDHKVLAMTIKSSCKEEAENGVLRQLPVGKVGNRFYAQPPTGFDDTGLIGDSRALMLGLLLGDGCFTESVGGVFLSCADGQLIVDLGPYLATHNIRLVHCQAGGGLMYRFSQIEQIAALRDGTTGRVLPGSRNPAKTMLESFGLYGKYAHDKTIPEEAFGWDNASVGALLAGLLVTDGSVYVNTRNRLPFVSFGSTSRRLVEQFRELMAWRFGIHFAPIKANNASRKRTLYSTELAKFADVKRLRSYLPLVGVKRSRYDELVATATTGTVDTNVRNRGRLDAPFRYKRKGQMPIGARPTYDIEVDHPDHLFVLVNGLIVSNSKHTGGVAGATKAQQGFPILDRLVSVPADYAGATHAETDGTVGSVADAPHGGKFVSVDGVQHHVRPEYKVTVKPGDTVEAGDVLSDGPPNPAKFVEHKGLGEARRLFVEAMMKAARDAGFNPHRRNVELIARGFLDHVEAHEEGEDHVPGDVVSYTAMAAGYRPRPGHVRVAPDDALGKYLERPALHYTIGTKVRPSVVAALKAAGVSSVPVHDAPPPFSPVTIRSHETINIDRDPTTRMLGSGLEKALLKGTVRGDVIDPTGTSWVPALAEGTNFGLKGKSVAWKA